MEAELIGPDDDPQIRVTMSLAEAYQVQAGGAPRVKTPEFAEFERQVFGLLEKTRSHGVEAGQQTTFEYTVTESAIRGIIVVVHNCNGRGVGVVEDGRDIEEALFRARRSMVSMGFIDDKQQVLFVSKERGDTDRG